MVWGELAQWLLVDEDLAGLLGLFDGGRNLGRVLREHARRSKRPVRDIRLEALKIVEELHRRGILSPNATVRPIEPEPVKIANVTVNLTNRCNLHCAWCYNAARTTDEMPVETLMDAVERGKGILEPNGSFIILGGEPLIDADRLSYALRRAEDVFRPASLISTNGTLLTGSAVEKLRSRRVEVQVSLDSHRADRHDAIRGRGVFEKAVAGIRRLVDAGVTTIVSMVFTRESMDEFEPYLDLALKLGVNEARFIPLRTIGFGLTHRDARPDFAASFEHLMGILGRRPELRRLLRRDFFSIAMTLCRYSTPRTGCGIARKVIFIDADGCVYPCPNHVRPEYLCGDLREAALSEIILRSPVLQALRRQYRVANYGRCRDCAFRYWCAGDCRGEVLATMGDATAESPHCQELQQMFRQMLWLIAQGDTRLGTAPEPAHGKAAREIFVE